ncbi:MAG: hypothetical protein HAW59_04235, partial [Betaproteobacteria bacterium]|nr:hypothetical protein [Betaproteobacteria bacterium]
MPIMTDTPKKSRAKKPLSPPDSPMAARLKELQKLVPWAFCDGALDAEMISRMTGAPIAPDADRYRFQWAGS